MGQPIYSLASSCIIVKALLGEKYANICSVWWLIYNAETRDQLSRNHVSGPVRGAVPQLRELFYELPGLGGPEAVLAIWRGPALEPWQTRILTAFIFDEMDEEEYSVGDARSADWGLDRWSWRLTSCKCNCTSRGFEVLRKVYFLDSTNFFNAPDGRPSSEMLWMKSWGNVVSILAPESRSLSPGQHCPKLLSGRRLCGKRGRVSFW